MPNTASIDSRSSSSSPLYTTNLQVMGTPITTTYSVFAGVLGSLVPIMREMVQVSNITRSASGLPFFTPPFHIASEARASR